MKVFVYTSHWHEGTAFEGSVSGRAFATREEAEREMANEKTQAVEIMSNEYGGYWDEDERDANNNVVNSLVGDSDECQNDWWEGTITECEI